MATNRDQIILSFKIQEEFTRMHRLLTNDIRDISYNPQKRLFEIAPPFTHTLNKKDLGKLSADAEAIKEALIRFGILSPKNAKKSVTASCAYAFATHFQLAELNEQKEKTNNIPSILCEAQENGWEIAAENVTLAVKMPVTEDTRQRLESGVIALKADNKIIDRLSQANVDLWSMATTDHIGVVERALQRAPQLEEAMMQIAKNRLNAQKTSQLG